MEELQTLFDSNSEYYEQAGKIDEESLSFRVHASLIYKLGESLIGDDITALSELIKNTYDADASICFVSIDSNCEEVIDGNIYRGKIEIRDNGCGMDLPAITNGWLTISNSPKKKMKKENRTTTKYKRWPLGDKGLGRLSVQKLGRYMEMTTKTESSAFEYIVTIPWGDFLKNTTIDQIPVKIVKNPVEDEERKKASYTTIIIRDLVDRHQWEQEDQVNALSGTLSKIISPFRSKTNSFRVIASVNGEPVKVDTEAFDELLRTARAKYTVKYDEGRADIRAEYKSSFFFNRNVVKQVSGKQVGFTDTLLDDFLSVNSSNLKNLHRVQREGFVFEENDECLFPDIVTKNKNGQREEHWNPGSFEFEIYEYYQDSDYLDLIYKVYDYSSIINRDEYKKFVERYYGIKVVRDGFLVQGYGEGEGGDWLGLSSSSKTSGKFFDFRNDSVIGCVYLTGTQNAVLKETTNRQGFVEDEYYKNFRKILRSAIRRLNLNRYKLNRAMTDYLKSSKAHSAGDKNGESAFSASVREIKSQIRTAAKNVEDNSIRMDAARRQLSEMEERVKTDTDSAEDFAKPLSALKREMDDISTDSNKYKEQLLSMEAEVDAVQNEFQKMNERLQDLFELAGLGLSVETFTHEFDSSIRNIKSRNKSIVDNRAAATTDSLIRHINYVSHALDALRKQMSYFNPGLKFVRAERQIFEVREFLEQHRAFYEERCRRREIDFILTIQTDFAVRINKGMLNQVFDNLFNNSEYWLEFSAKYGHLKRKEYHIEVKERGYILVWDNGTGISHDIENRLFEPFESKKQNGRGLGLYIVAGNLKYNSGNIRLLEERNTEGNLYKFEINLLDVTQ